MKNLEAEEYEAQIGEDHLHKVVIYEATPEAEPKIIWKFEKKLNLLLERA